MDKELLILFGELKENRDNLYKMLEGNVAQSNAISIRKGIEESIKTDILLRLKVKESQVNKSVQQVISSPVDITEKTISEKKQAYLTEKTIDEDTFIPSINIGNASFSDHSSIKTKNYEKM